MVQHSGVDAISHSQHELSSPDSLCASITSAVASAEGCSVLELDPLYDAIDVSALAALFTSRRSETERSGTVTFPYHGYDVTVIIAGDYVTVILDEPSTLSSSGPETGSE